MLRRYLTLIIGHPEGGQEGSKGFVGMAEFRERDE